MNNQVLQRWQRTTTGLYDILSVFTNHFHSSKSVDVHLCHRFLHWNVQLHWLQTTLGYSHGDTFDLVDLQTGRATTMTTQRRLQVTYRKRKGGISCNEIRQLNPCLSSTVVYRQQNDLNSFLPVIDRNVDKGGNSMVLQWSPLYKLGILIVTTSSSKETNTKSLKTVTKL